MGYSDAKYYARPQVMVADPDVATGTITASGSNAVATAFTLPTFNRRTAVNKVKAVIKTAPATNLTVVTLNFLNGTSTFAVATIGTNAAGSVVEVTPTANNTFTASGQPTVTVIGTGTASAQSYGAYEVFFESQELYS